MKFITKVECIKKNTRVWKYYIFGRIPFLTKEKCFDYRKTFLFGVCISSHYTKDKIVVNDINYSNIFKKRDDFTTFNQHIDIIIPIYNGYEYLEGLFDSIWKNTDLNYHIIAVNDCSPDIRINDFLQKQIKRFENRITIINNEINLGFVKSVNTALKISKNHVCLLNTDVVLPKNWATRLFSPILNDNKIASVTPFSNAATIFSLPCMNIDNPFNENLEKINNALAKIVYPKA